MNSKKFHINGSLTQLRHTILYVMRQVKKKQPYVINSCNSSDCSVVAWLHATSAFAKTKYRKIIVNSKNTLYLFLQQELNKDYTWPNVSIAQQLTIWILILSPMQYTNYASVYIRCITVCTSPILLALFILDFYFFLFCSFSEYYYSTLIFIN